MKKNQKSLKILLCLLFLSLLGRHQVFLFKLLISIGTVSLILRISELEFATTYGIQPYKARLVISASILLHRVDLTCLEPSWSRKLTD